MKRVLALCLLVTSLVLIGCDDDKLEDEYASQNIVVDNNIKDINERSGEEVPAPKLAEGDTLTIRLVYKINEEDENAAEWYKVELNRKDTSWTDTIKMEGITRDPENHWDDYKFFSKNFNYQIEEKAYGIDTLDGTYILTISGSNGFNDTYELFWENGGWTNIDPARTFYVE